MWLDRAIQFHVAVLSVLGAIFVGLRHDMALIPALAAIVAVASVLVTDILGWVRLNRWVANAMIVVAVGWSLREFIQISPEEKLMAIASMLCYLQIALLLQEKTTRIYWQLIVLSMVEVVVASALDLGPQFGVLFVFYAVIAISALVLLCLLRDVRRTTLTFPATENPRHAWQLLLAQPQLTPLPISESELRLAVTPRLLIRQTILLSAVTLLFAAVFFYATPRVGDRSWLASRSGGAATGFKPEVSLENKGRIHLSSQIVMRAALSRLQDRRPIELYGEPYFQGASLTDYLPEERGGRWVPWRPYSSSSSEPRGGLRLQTASILVRQDIILEATTSRRRFAIMPTQPASDMAVISYGPSQRSEAENLAIPRQQRYAVATPSIASGRQLKAIPLRPPPPDAPQNVDAELARNSAFDDSLFPRLAETASQVLEEHELLSGSSLDKALALEHHFKKQDAYHYSLNLNVARNYDIDPIEDFVANHRTGHCEYFASALVMMLRSQGIPARMITGYKGGSFNSVGQYFVVQQRHAHSWVEAWVPSDEVPASEFAGMAGDYGAWYRLDPTPGSEALSLANATGVGASLAQAYDYVELLWRDYVLSLNPSRQEDNIYAPLQAKTSLLPSWVESRSVQRWLRRMSSLWGLEFGPDRGRANARVFEGSLAVLIIGGLVLLLIVAQGARVAGRLLWRRAQSRRDTARGVRRPPDFYRRLERLLARLPLTRQRGQTAEELATAAQARLISVEGAALTAHVPGDVVDAYYRVRFGDDRLDKNETDAIEQALDALAPAVRQARKR